MAEAAIPVDLLNPGQVFACLGLMETALVLHGSAAALFDWSADPVRFRLAVPDTTNPVPDTTNPVREALAFLARATVTSRAPASSGNRTDKPWGVQTVLVRRGEAFPSADPPSPATLPAVLEDDQGRRLMLSHWEDAGRDDKVKFWAGAAGYPGAALLRDARALVQDALAATALDQTALDPFAIQAPQSSSFRFDFRRDYIPLDAGFSPNRQSSVRMVGFPLVEIFAAIGLSYARPLRPNRRDKLAYRYAVIGHDRAGAPLLPPALIRAGLGDLPDPIFPQRRFLISLGWPGQEGQARAITDVIEES